MDGVRTIWQKCYWSLLGLVLLSLFVGCGGKGSEAPCLTNDDCLLKGEICRSNICVLQDTCTTDTDCKYKGETCRSGLCSNVTGPPPIQACPDTCKLNGDCSECSDEKTACIQGKCAEPKRVGAYERCGDDIATKCQDKLVCSGTTTNKYCLPECNPKEARCDNNKGKCFDPNGLGAGLCIPDGQANEGDPCHANFTGDTKLETTKLCKEGLYCPDKGTCAKIVEVGDYSSCEPGKTCKGSAVCVVLNPSSGARYCLPQCDPAQKVCNSGNGGCVQLNSGKGVCLPNGTAKQDASCGPEGPQLKPDAFCSGALQCVAFPNSTMCLQPVAECNETACPQDRVCLPGQNGGVCAIPCQNNTCANGLKCQPLTIGSTTVPVCVP